MSYRRKSPKTIIELLIIIAILYLQHFFLTYSASVGLKNNLLMNWKWVLLNIAVSMALFLAILLISGRVCLSLILSNILIFALGLCNYYTFLFHGRPFFASDFYSIPTAINVLV